MPEGFNDRIAASGLLGTSVLWFERDEAGFQQPSAWSPTAMATTTTHDLPTVAGWWSESDIDWQVTLSLLPDAAAERAHRAARALDRVAVAAALGVDSPDAASASSTPPVDAAISYVCDTPAPLAMLPVEDLLGLTEQPNLPGTSSGHPNWCRRLPMTRLPFFDEPDVARRIDIAQQCRGSAS